MLFDEVSVIDFIRQVDNTYQHLKMWASKAEIYTLRETLHQNKKSVKIYKTAYCNTVQTFSKT